LLRSGNFVRAARRALRKNPHAAGDIQTTLELLAENAFHPQLHTHKLKGKLEGSWACSAGYDLRIVFKFVSHEASEAILLETMGTHEEVY
jgi:mRNA-degrading endonuclease YafQ of YafQ-DinJ toxin-antitoxin module